MSQTPKNKNVKTYIYTLLDPVTKEVRYIGKTIQPLKYRLTSHINSSKKGNNYRINWIKSILNKNNKPLIRLLDECPWNQSQKREIFWIDLFKEQGFNLVNNTIGGEGCIGVKRSKEFVQNIIDNLSKKVYQYDLKGNYIRSFKNAKIAGKKIGLKTYRKINAAAKKHGGMSWRFLWSYVKIDKFPPYKKNIGKMSYERHNKGRKQLSCSLKQYTLDGVLLKSWSSIWEASIELNFNYGNMTRYLRNKKCSNKIKIQMNEYKWEKEEKKKK